MSDANSPLLTAIDKIVEQHAQRLKQACAQFHIALPGRAYPERSITYFYIGALAEALDGGTVIAEVPFPNADGSISNNHLDAIVFNDEVAILAEFKRSWTPNHWLDLAHDIPRVLRLADSILPRFRDKRSRTLFGFYGSDSWRSQAAHAWKTGEVYRGWQLPPEFERMNRGAMKVWDRTDDSEALQQTQEDGYFWIWACEQLLPKASPS